MNDTESVQRGDAPLDLCSTGDLVERLLDGQRRAIEAAVRARASLAAAIDAAASRLGDGDGRLVMAGAGASGRLCVQDGAELWPTFGWPAERTLLVMAGGEQALVKSVEGVEDDARRARREVQGHSIGPADVVLAVAASGRSPWTVSWLGAARERGAVSIGMAANPGTPLLDGAEYPVLLHTGAEVLAGSTRLAAGTAQKAALNTFSTGVMVRLNRTHDNLMVDMAAVNRKLDLRRVAMVRAILPDADDSSILAALDRADGWVKLAVLIVQGDEPESARRRLARGEGSLRRAMANNR